MWWYKDFIYKGYRSHWSGFARTVSQPERIWLMISFPPPLESAGAEGVQRLPSLHRAQAARPSAAHPSRDWTQGPEPWSTAVLLPLPSAGLGWHLPPLQYIPHPTAAPPKPGYRSDLGGLGNSWCSRADTFQKPIDVQVLFFKNKMITFYI